MANQTARYETILVFDSSLGEEAVGALSEKFKALIAEYGTIEKIEDWGKRRLAYPINDLLEGNYLLVQFESGPEFPAELNRVCEITEGVFRVLVVRNEAAQTPTAPVKAEPAQAEVKEEAPAEPEAPAAAGE